VNRIDAVREIMRIHSTNSSVAVNDEGDSLIIPYVDNLWGMGKSSLGRNYIAACRKLFQTDTAFHPETSAKIYFRIGKHM